MRIIICGGRNYDDLFIVTSTLLEYEAADPTIIHGSANGADGLAAQAAILLGYQIERYPADWKKHARAAGPIRNKKMLESGADLVIAFPGGKGTANMVKLAEDAGVPVRRIDA